MGNLRCPLYKVEMPPNPSFSTQGCIDAMGSVSALSAWPGTRRIGCSSPLIQLTRFLCYIIHGRLTKQIKTAPKGPMFGEAIKTIPCK
jgi:hypothetical protein